MAGEKERHHFVSQLAVRHLATVFILSRQEH